MEKERKKLTFAEITERKKSLATERNTRVIWADIPDTHRLIDMTTALNRAVKRLRHQLGYRVSFEEGIRHLKALKDLEISMDKITGEICACVGVKYRSPVSLQKAVDLTVGDVKESVTEKVIDSKMEMAYASDNGGDGMFANQKKR